MSLIFGQGVFGQGVFGGTPIASLVASTGVVGTTGLAATIATDPTTGDLALSDLKIVRGDAAIEQKVRQVLQFFQGEWFLDTRLGMPYYQSILNRKNPSLPAVKSIFRKALLKVQQIVSVRSMSLTLDKRTRRASLDFVAVLDDARTLTAETEPFILP